MWWQNKWAAGDCNAGVKPFNFFKWWEFCGCKEEEIRKEEAIRWGRDDERQQRTEKTGKRIKGRICYVALTQYFILGPCVVYYLPPLCFCPTSSAHTRRANNTPAKLIGNTHTHTYIQIRQSKCQHPFSKLARVQHTVGYPVRASTRGYFPIKSKEGLSR